MINQEPLPTNFDYQGNERLPGYVRGVTNVRCGKCNTTGKGGGRNAPWCDDCGGYGCVPAVRVATFATDRAADDEPSLVAALIGLDLVLD